MKMRTLDELKATRDKHEPEFVPEVNTRFWKAMGDKQAEYRRTGELWDGLSDAIKRIEALRECLGFFASVIKSGEPWTDACQAKYDALLSAGLTKTAN